MIAQAHVVESYFGYWPTFSDGKIIAFAYEAPHTLLMGISYIDAETNRGARIQLRFSGVSEVHLSELRSENVIDSLQISTGQLMLEACYGLEGQFNFKEAAVVSLQPIAN
jgi:hypothetical protein